MIDRKRKEEDMIIDMKLKKKRIKEWILGWSDGIVDIERGI